MEIMVYEMKYVKDGIGENSISCIPFEQKSFQQYMKIYNACFYEMRKSLDIKPYNFLSDQLLLQGMNHIRQISNGPILLHVAKWNEKALKLYEKVGFNITNTERVR